jgi:uncharacterized protein
VRRLDASARIDAMSGLKERIQDDMKAALRSGDKRRLGTLRLMLAAVQQREIDERIALNDAETLVVLDRMIKQRQDALSQYQAAGRDELAQQEQFEIETIRSYMPAPLSEAELGALIDRAIHATGAGSAKDMGKVMAELRPQIQGRADMAQVSTIVRNRLATAT